MLPTLGWPFHLTGMSRNWSQKTLGSIKLITLNMTVTQVGLESWECSCLSLPSTRSTVRVTKLAPVTLSRAETRLDLLLFSSALPAIHLHG